MPFIAKNPLNIPEIGTTPPLPMPGTRGLFAKEDGWYDIDSDGIIRKLARSENTGGYEGVGIQFWQSGKAYKKGDVVYKPKMDDGLEQFDMLAKCLSDHTSAAAFDEDMLGNGYWETIKGVEAEFAEYCYLAYSAENADYANSAGSDSLGNAIHETYATKKEISNTGGDNSPKQAIQFTNGFRIESREDGLYLVDAMGEEIGFYYGEHQSYAFVSEQANWAAEANFAYGSDIASTDDEGRPLKGVVNRDYEDKEDVDTELYDGETCSYGVISKSLIVTVGNVGSGYMSALYFTTPSEIPENYTQFPDIVYFKGDSTDEGAFVPESDTRYSIGFFHDGNSVVGCVLGVPAPSVSEVTE